MSHNLMVLLIPDHPQRFIKVSSFIGLAPRPLTWYATLSTFLEKHGYKRGTIDKTLFIRRNKKDIMLVQVYVDDIIFGSTNKSWCDEFEALMQSRFQMSSMGELTFSLGPKTESSRTGRNLSYLKTSNSKRLLLTQCRQEIIKYHKGKPNLGYVYPRESPLDLEAISDSDYGGSILDRKPQQVVVNFLSKTYSWPCSHLRSPVRHTKPIPFSSVHLHLSCQTPQDHQFPISAMTQSWRSRSGESHDDERTGAKIDDLIGHRQIRHDDIVLLFRQHRQTDWGGGALSLEVLQWMKATLMVGSERQYSRIDLRSDTQRIELDAMYWYGLRKLSFEESLHIKHSVRETLQIEMERTESETEAAAPKGNKDQGEVDSSRVTSGVSIPVSTQGQAGSDPEKAHEALAGPDPEPMQEDQTGSNSGKLHNERIIEDNPESHSGSMSSMKNLEDTDNFGDQFLYDKPTEDDQEKSKVVDESDSTIPDPSHQTVTTNPPVIAPEVLSFSSTKPSFSLVHTSFNATQKATNKSPHLPRDHFILRLLARMARLEQEMSEIKKTGSS
ncbi:putative ribonuclease H-like domain-containing protein [Tanacetum coccineum]